MPRYRSIEIALHSQFDITTLPEYYPEPRAVYIARGIHGFIPERVDEKTSTCSVYVPVYPGSIFWIGYTVLPPVPDGHFFLFKLFINGAHVANWSTGKDEEWKGKTMFGLFENAEGDDERRRIQKRVLRFTPPAEDTRGEHVLDMFDETACIELKIHRASGRKRVERQVEPYDKTEHAKMRTAVDLVYAGHAGPNHPKRFYKFALIDPVDKPFATFRYYYRTWEQIQDLGFLDPYTNTEGEECDLSVIEPFIEQYGTGTHSRASKETNEAFEDCYDGGPCEARAESYLSKRNEIENKYDSWKTANTDVESVHTHRPSTPGYSVRHVSNSSVQPRVYIPRGAPQSSSSSSTDEETAEQRDSFAGTPPNFYRLSIPPAIKFEPPGNNQGSRVLPSIPRKQKRDSTSSTSYRPHPAYPIERWATRTPSPVKSRRESIGTPPLEKRKDPGRPAVSLMGMITSTFKRRGGEPSTISEGSRSTRNTF